MTHDTKVQDWYDARKEFLGSVYVESAKRTKCDEWLAGETPQKFVADQLESWMKENPFPEA
jgi:hypothetical protein